MASILRVNTLTDASSNNSIATSIIYGGATRTWVTFDGTASGATVGDSFNVSSSDDDGTGNTGDGDGENREQYGAVDQYSGPPSDVVEGEGITTLPTTLPNFIQRFKVKEPYVQAKGEDYVADLQAIADRMKKFYTV